MKDTLFKVIAMPVSGVVAAYLIVNGESAGYLWLGVFILFMTLRG